MKKNRPGTLVTVIAPAERRDALAGVLFTDTTTIGVRHQEMLRERLERTIVTVETPCGPIRFKVSARDGRTVNAVARVRGLREGRRRAGPADQGSAGPGDSRLDGAGVALMARFYITTPIYYINAEPHLGHAYTSMVADAIARSRRLLDDDVFFLTGTDEHGQKVERAAQKAGLRHARVRRSDRGEVSRAVRAARTSRTTISSAPPSHATSARRRRSGAACGTAATSTRPPTRAGTAPSTSSSCPRRSCSKAAAVRPAATPVERLSEESYFFRLSQFTEPLLEHYRKHPEFITPEIRRNEMMAFVSAGLQDLSVSRTSFKWGIPVPDDPAHVMYVWFDALTNYLTAAGFPDDQARLDRYWPADVHLMGKEIVRQHTVYWPAFLMAADLPVPKRVIGHGWWLMNEAKMSKSLGNVVRPQGYVERFGVDALRYFVMREMVLGQDANFADEAFLTRYNADLANDLGNVVSRVTTMIQRYCGGVVPAVAPDVPGGARGRADAQDRIDHRGDARGRGGVRLQPGAARDVGADLGAQQVHRCARAVGAGEGARVTAAARRDAVHRGRRAAGRRVADRAGDAVGVRRGSGACSA